MRYPNYESHQDIAAPVAGLIDIYARTETEVVLESKSKSWSQLLGELSVMHVRGIHKRKDRMFRQLKEQQPLPSQYRPLHDILRFPKNKGEVARAQQRMHAVAIERLGAIATDDKGFVYRNFERGRLAEFTALGLLTRYAHPWILAAPALPHHESDGNRLAKHFDIAVSFGSSNGDESHALQIKSLCRQTRSRHYREFENKTKQYDHSIQIISGCCDLKLPVHPRLGTHAGTAQLLIDEFNDKVDDRTVAHLDKLTNDLIFNISADLLPRGTASPVAAHA